MAARKPKEMEPPFTPRIVGGTRSRRAKAGNGRGTLRDSLAAMRSGADAPAVPAKAKAKAAGKASARKRKKVGRTRRKTKQRNRAKSKRQGRAKIIQTECFADIKIVEIDYVWEPFLPLGMLVLIQGDSKVGKSFITCFIAATETAKGPWPGTDGAKGEGGNVLFLTREDSAEQTIKPRLKAMGADMHRIHRPLKGEVVTLEDVEVLREVIRRHKVRVVVFDPITDYLPKWANIDDDVSMRKVLEPLAQLAEGENCCVAVVRHCKKGRGGRSMQQGYGSVGITAIARSEILIGNVCGRRTLIQLANNNRRAGTALGFEITDNGLTFSGRCSMRVEDILSPPKNSDRYIQAFLRATLPCPVVEGRKKAKKAGIKTKPLDEVVNKLGVLRERVPLKGQGRGKCYYRWRFPDVPSVPPQA